MIEKICEEIARRDSTDGTVKVFSGKEVIEIVQEIAKEYKKLNRCDTCIHFTDEEIVPPICYFCCKGMEDNYKAREEEA